MIASRSHFNITGVSGALPLLDGLRGLAILLVLLRHGTLPFDDIFQHQHSHLWIFIRNGWLGVDLFFVLSGFLIARTLSQSQAPGDSAIFPKRFLFNRFIRTLPTYYVVIALCLAGAFPYFTMNIESTFREMLIHAVFLQDYLGTNIQPPLWSLATEEKFYLIAPLILLLSQKIKPPAVRISSILSIVLASAMLRYIASQNIDTGSYSVFFWSVRAPFHQCLDGLMIGVLAWELYNNKKALPYIRRNANEIFIFGVFILTFEPPRI